MRHDVETLSQGALAWAGIDSVHSAGRDSS